MNLNKVIKDLKDGVNVGDNLALYAGELARSYYNMSVYTLAMNLTLNYDLIMQDHCEDAERVRSLFERVLRVVDAVFVRGDLSDLSAGTREIFNVRDALTRKTDALNRYTYTLELYEHVINRVEYRFKDIEDFEDPKELRRKVMDYIQSDKDISVTNRRIQMVMSELPVRLTKIKFYDMVRHSSQSYIGARNDIVETYFEKLNSCMRPVVLEGHDPEYTELYAICERFLTMDVENIDSETYERAAADMSRAGKIIADNLRVWLYLIDIVNDLLEIMMTLPSVDQKSVDMTRAESVIREVMRSEKMGTFLRPDEDIVGLLRKLTDRQSVYQDQHLMLENAMPEIINLCKDAIHSCGLWDQYSELQMCAQLSKPMMIRKLVVRDCFFKVDRDWLNVQLAKTENLYDELFKKLSRPLKRAVMSVAFMILPVTYDRIEDVGDYIEESLEGCRDRAERAACEDLLGRLISLNQERNLQ